MVTSALPRRLPFLSCPGHRNRGFGRLLHLRQDFQQRDQEVPGHSFQCPNNGYCLPVFLRCNQVFDCPLHEDEADCDAYTCPGMYRCRGSKICVHPDHVCDGRHHCPQHDDEFLCNFTCPQGCVCYGMAFVCPQRFPAKDYPELRYLHAQWSNMSLEDMANNPFLVHLDLSHCGLTSISYGPSLENLLVLDLSYNRLTDVDFGFLSIMFQLRNLSLAGNPLTWPFHTVRDSFGSLESLQLSQVSIPDLNVSIVATTFPNLHVLNVSHSEVKRVLGDGFRQLPLLTVVDLQGCLVAEFPREMFQSLSTLEFVYAESFKLCCPVLLPQQFNLRRCTAPADQLSSCEDLLGSLAYVVSLFVIAVLAMAGNFGSFLFRTIFNKSRGKFSFGVFVTNLCVSDFLMGAYLMVIGSADRLYQGTYLWNEHAWKHSAACRMAGFLSFLSGEVSALIMCLITLDRFIALRFPYSNLHFTFKSANIACLAVWCVGILLALIPLLPPTAHWDFYGQTAICIPLPITRNDFPGHAYSFTIIIVFNFALFLFVSIGQAVIYWSIRANSMSANNTTKKIKDLTIARRLITVAMSNFLCWFPIGLLGLLAKRGVVISREVNVGMAVFVLPINSALNPFLYTLNVIMERRRRARDKRMIKFITAQLKLEMSAAHTSTSTISL